MKHRILTLLISVLFLFSISIPAFASDVVIETEVIETEEERIERVYEEVLTGNITNHLDVIAVALTQYQPPASACSVNSNDNDSNDCLKITQELGSVTNLDGSTDISYAATSLLIVDEEGNQVSAASASEYVGYVTNNGSVSEYSVYATHTMYVNVHIDNPDNMLDPGITIRLNRITTTLTYGTAVGAGKLIQTYEVYLGAYDFQNKDLSTTHTHPSAGTYTYSPDSTWYTVPNTIYSYMKSRAIVYVGTKVLEIPCIEPLDSASFSNLQT